MAKKKATVEVEVKDGGSFKKVAMNSKKAGDGIDSVAKNSKNAQKNVKGVAQTASAAGKQFAGMSRGMGGLVGAYAAFAAEIFAVTAAFNFLKSAGDLKVLQEGQNIYASTTGIAMRTLAKDIVEATDAQINFQDAAQAAAIGKAAGLQTQQLKALGTAAKNVSIVLGRDVTDSFNRLVRGVTKAEPELLDELGIVLRLNDASETYAAQLGKAAKDLTQFEKSQAVANDVLRQANEKFNDVVEGSGASVNVYNQLAKTFDDVIIKVKELTDIVAGPFAKVLRDTPSLAIAALGLLLTGPLKALGINFKEIASSSRASAAEQTANYKKLKLEAAAYSSNVKTITAI